MLIVCGWSDRFIFDEKSRFNKCSIFSDRNSRTDCTAKIKKCYKQNQKTFSLSLLILLFSFGALALSTALLLHCHSEYIKTKNLNNSSKFKRRFSFHPIQVRSTYTPTLQNEASITSVGSLSQIPVFVEESVQHL